MDAQSFVQLKIITATVLSSILHTFRSNCICNLTFKGLVRSQGEKADMEDKICRGDVSLQSKQDIQLNEAINTNELLDDKIVHMIISRSEKAEKYGTAVTSIKNAINRHWQELEALRKSKEIEDIENAKYLKVLVEKVSGRMKER